MKKIDEEKKILAVHHGGKMETVSKNRLATRADLSRVYTPGVALVSKLIARNQKLKNKFTIAGNTIAIVSDGSAVLGLGDIGPAAALPVMEGKAMLFKKFADLNAFPICLATQNVDEIVRTVKLISPVFAGINLEDISAPRCFEIERRLQNLGMPVMHDDQHGTAVVVLAALLNASKVSKKKLADCRLVISGAGAAGTAIARFISPLVKDIIVVDSRGIIVRGRRNLNQEKKLLLKITNKDHRSGGLAEALIGVDVFIGVSKPGIVTSIMIKSMAPRPIVFALSNPVPEIMPTVAKHAGAFIVATGRSDFFNQVNNALAFPGIFLGAVQAGATKITPEMKLAAAKAIAAAVSQPQLDKIVPSIFERGLAQKVAIAVARAWRKSNG